MMNKNNIQSILIYFILSVVTVLAFQNCGNVKVQSVEPPPQPSIKAKGISGKLCTANQAVTSVSRYELVHFVILNMTAVTKNAVIEPDSNVNGVPDRLETNLADIPTIRVSKTDTDGDGIPDFIEEIRGMSQNTEDLYVDGTDLDGINNYDELVQGSDPASSASPPELNQYKVLQISADADCDPSQKTYQFNIQNLQRVAIPALNDTVNGVDTSLSHDKDENVYLVYAHMIPDRVTMPDKKLYKIFRVKKDDPDFFLEMGIGDFKELPAAP